MVALSPGRSGRAAETRYADVSSKLRTAIVSGRYVPGSLLPTEHELAEMHGVSRQTIRTALRSLEEHGYISRKKGVGTRVETPQPAMGYTHFFNSLQDLVHVASVEIRRIETVERVTMDGALARRTGAPLGSEWVCFSGPRVDARNPGRLLSWTRIFLDARFACISDMVLEQPQTLVASLLERECGQSIEEVHQQVSAMLMDEDIARALKADPASAALCILRHYKANRSDILEITETIYPSDRVHVVTRLRRSKLRRVVP